MLRGIVVGLLGAGCGPPTVFGIGTDGIEPLVGERQIQVQAGGAAGFNEGYAEVGDASAATVTWSEPLSDRVSIATSIGAGIGDMKDWSMQDDELSYFYQAGVEGRFRLVNDLDAPLQVAVLSGLQWQGSAPRRVGGRGYGGRAGNAAGASLGVVVAGRVGPVRPYVGVKGNGTWGTWPGIHGVGSVGATWQPPAVPEFKLGVEGSALVGTEGVYAGGSVYGRWTFGTPKSKPSPPGGPGVGSSALATDKED